MFSGGQITPQHVVLRADPHRLMDGLNSVALVMEFPFTKAFPSLGSNNPHNMEMAVVLPAPLGPCGKEEEAEE